MPSVGWGEGRAAACLQGWNPPEEKNCPQNEDVDRTCKSFPGDQSRGGVVLDGGVWRQEGYQL